MSGLFYILLFWLIGNALSILTGGYVSGNIIGMILLFAALCLHWVKAETVRPAARFLLGAMALFFVPYGVGLMDSYRVILDNLWAIVISGIASTIIVLLVTGQTFQQEGEPALRGKDRVGQVVQGGAQAGGQPAHGPQQQPGQDAGDVGQGEGGLAGGP